MTRDISKDEPVYNLCTGGIRCVKVGAYMKQYLGFDNFKRLKHGIIGYQQWLEDNPEVKSVWEGENVLFDKRGFEEKEVQE
jgi:predicted sulfurtransferase